MDKSKTLIVISLILLLVLTLFNHNMFARIKINKSDDGFEDPGKEAASGMGTYIIEGAAYFLKSHANYLLFLQKIELSDLTGMDYSDLRDTLNSTIDDMNAARVKYTLLKDEADNRPYNYMVIWKLILFDYENFQEERGLIPLIFNDVKGYLQYGDIRGVYARELSGVLDIINLLERIKEAIDADRLPAMNDLWRLNQKYGEALYFGQYVAEVFANIQD